MPSLIQMVDNTFEHPPQVVYFDETYASRGAGLMPANATFSHKPLYVGPAWLPDVEQAVASVVGLLACGNALRNCPTYLITREGADTNAAVRAQRCALKPLLSPLASPFAVLEAEAPRVLLLQLSREHGTALLTATSRKRTA